MLVDGFCYHLTEPGWLFPTMDFNMQWPHTQRRTETGSRSTTSWPCPQLMEFDLSAVSYLLFKETYSLLRDLHQSHKHMRLVSVFCTAVCVTCWTAAVGWKSCTCWAFPKHSEQKWSTFLTDSWILELCCSNMTTICRDDICLQLYLQLPARVTIHASAGLKVKDRQVNMMSLSLQGLWSRGVWLTKQSVWWMRLHSTLWHSSWMSASHKSSCSLSAFPHVPKHMSRQHY